MGKLHISVSPHFHAPVSVQSVMRDVIIALMPATLAGVAIFGWRALAVIVFCVCSSVLAEFLFNKITKREQSVKDLSAIITGLLLALNLPANVPIWQAVIGSVFAIVVVKCLFGGMGCNVVNPAITARVFMIVAFGSMTKIALPTIVDTASSATPLVDLAAGKSVDLMSLFLGTTGGTIGETCVAALLLGFVYLLIRRVITWHIPVVYIATTYLFTLCLVGFDFTTALAWVMSGGLFIGAIFMATDYVTSPATPLGTVVFGIGCGLITVLIRFWGNYPEGVSFAILFMNILNPYIDKLTARKLFGGKAA